MQQGQQFQGNVPPPLGSTMLVSSYNSPTSNYKQSDVADPAENCTVSNHPGNVGIY